MNARSADQATVGAASAAPLATFTALGFAVVGHANGAAGRVLLLERREPSGVVLRARVAA